MKEFIKRLFRHLLEYLYAVGLPQNYDEYLRKQKKRQLEFNWREMNSHNFTHVGNENFESSFPLDKVMVGNYTYGALKVFSFGSSDETLKIGSFCSIAPNVKFILGGMHHLNHISTYPFIAYFKMVNEAFSKGPIILEDDVWIGTDVIILSGITIAKGSVIGAGSVVTKSTLPYSINGGNPAELIRFRFSQEVIDKLLGIDYSLLTPDFILNNIDLFNNDLSNEILQKLIGNNVKKL